MKIQILGTGCATCEELDQLVVQAARDLKIGNPVEKVTDVAEIASFGVLSLPSLAIDGEVVLSGVVPTYEKIKELLISALIKEEVDADQGGCSSCFG